MLAINTQPPTTTSHPDREEFYATVGQALSDWQLVEGEIGGIFSVVIGNPGGALSNAAYYSIQSFRVRLLMVNATASVFLRNYPNLQTQWHKLYERTDDKNTIRNYLAHYMAVIIKTKKGTKMVLHPTIFKFDNLFNPTTRKYDIKQIKAWGTSFENLHTSLRQFNGLLPRR
jgi:hypothetical protein